MQIEGIPYKHSYTGTSQPINYGMTDLVSYVLTKYLKYLYLNAASFIAIPAL